MRFWRSPIVGIGFWFFPWNRRHSATFSSWAGRSREQCRHRGHALGSIVGAAQVNNLDRRTNIAIYRKPDRFAVLLFYCQVVQALPPSYRKTFILVVLLGESYEKCAQICKVEIGTIKSRVNRARAMVMERLEAPKSAPLTALTSESGRTYGSSNRTP